MNDLLRSIWARWKKIAFAIGVFQTRLFFIMFYYVCLFPFAVALRFFGDPLGLKLSPSSAWRKRTTRDTSLRHLRKQS
ncbi:MAG TPA: hypothetical protein P5079_07375 [Elusimicrobiota bacterium]|nr:hypothetical protein [Elusimicrobiota bacterium]